MVLRFLIGFRYEFRLMAQALNSIKRFLVAHIILRNSCYSISKGRSLLWVTGYTETDNFFFLQQCTMYLTVQCYILGVKRLVGHEVDFSMLDDMGTVSGK